MTACVLVAAVTFSPGRCIATIGDTLFFKKTQFICNL
jgi:hypothetical protein